MSHLDELRGKYKALSEVSVPNDVRAKVHERIAQEAAKVPSKRTKRLKPALWISSVAAIVAVAGVAGGVISNTAKHPSESNDIAQNVGNATSGGGEITQGGPTWSIPSSIAWNGFYYATKGKVDKVGANLGVAAFPGPAKIFQVPGQDPDHEVALYTGAPYAKYVLAVRVPIVKIPESWMAIHNPEREPTITAGSKVQLFGDVFYRKLYGTTITVSLKRVGAKYPKLLTSQTFVVSGHGQINGTFMIPRNISAPDHTPFLLVFRGKSGSQVTTAYYYGLMFRKGGK